MPKKILLIVAAVVLFIFLLFLIGWFMKIRSIDRYLTEKYNGKFEFRYSFREYLSNFRSQYLQIHWGDNGWSYRVTVIPAERPELKFTCYLGIGTIYDNYTYKCLGAELKPAVIHCLSPDSGDYLLDIHLKHCNFVEMFDTQPTFAELKERYAGDSTFSFPPVTISIVYPIGGPQSVENILHQCMNFVQDTTIGTFTELGCLFVPADLYEELKGKQERLPEFLHDYVWPAYKKGDFPTLYIHSGQPEDVLLKRRQNTLRSYWEYVVRSGNS